MTSLAGSRVTVVTQFYWPEHVGIAPYSTRLAEHLADLGASVEVFTAMPHYPAWRVRPEYHGRFRVREEHGGVTVNRMWHYVPGRQSAVRRAGYEATLFAHAAARRSPPSDAVIGVIPSLSAGAVARVYARRQRCNYGIIVQDLSGQGARQSGISGGDLVGAATSAVERWVLAAADGVAVVTEAFRPHVEAAGVDPARIRLLRNWTEGDEAERAALSPAEASDLRRSLGWADGEQVVLHAGNMGLKQGLEFVVEAAREAQTRGAPMRFVLMGDGSQRPAIERQAVGVANLQLLPNMPRDRCNEIMSVADVLLVNERRTIVDMALPSKLTSYFVAGRPVVAAVSPEGTTAQELRRADAGVVVEPENPSALVDAVLKVAADPELGRTLASRGADYAARELSADRALEQGARFVADLL